MSVELTSALAGVALAITSVINSQLARNRARLIEEQRVKTKTQRDDDKKSAETRISLLEQRMEVVDKLVEKVDRMNYILIEFKTIVQQFITEREKKENK